MSKLIDEAPLLVLPTLATLVGLNEAIILQQVHFWLDVYGQERNGRKWIWKTQAQWEKDFTFWSGPTIRRAIDNLETRKLLLSTDLWNSNGGDRTKWYSVDRDAVNALTDEKHLIKMISRSDQNDQLMLLTEVRDSVVVDFVELDIEQEQQQCSLSPHYADPRVRAMLDHPRLGYLIYRCRLIDYPKSHLNVSAAMLIKFVNQFGMDRVGEAGRWYCWMRDIGKADSAAYLTACLTQVWGEPKGWRDEMYLSEEERLRRYAEDFDEDAAQESVRRFRSNKWPEIES